MTAWFQAAKKSPVVGRGSCAGGVHSRAAKALPTTASGPEEGQPIPSGPSRTGYNACTPSTDGPIATAWNIRGWPTIYVLDHKGVIRYEGVRGEAMDKAVDQLLAEISE